MVHLMEQNISEPKIANRYSLESEAGQFENSSWNWEEKHQRVNIKSYALILHKEGLWLGQDFQAAAKF